MSKKLLFLIIVLVLISSVSAEKVIVMLKDDFSVDNRIDMVEKQQNKVLKKISGKFGSLNSKKLKVDKKFSLTNGFSAEVDSAGLLELKKDPNVLKVYPVREYKIKLDTSVPVINGDNVWNLQLDNNITGTGETICVLDTGIDYNHSALTHAYIGGYDYVNDDDDPWDDHGHGTHCAGIIASNDSTYTGVSPDSNIVAIKVLNSGGGGNTEGLIYGIEDCINNYSASVISMSLGDDSYHRNTSCDDYDAALTSAINLAVANGINVVIASGNEGNKTGISAPACVANATSIGRSDDTDGIDSSSNSASILDLLAPGTDIYSSFPSNTWASTSGTSMSTPHVAGAIALLRQFVREYNGSNLSNYESINVLKNTGVGLTDINGVVTPRVDVYSAIYSLDTSPPIINLDSPENKIYLINNISFNYSIKDAFLDTIWYEYDGVNTTLNENTSLNLNYGDHNLIVYANDSKGYINFTSVNFSIKKFIFDGLSPENDYTNLNGNINFDCNISSKFGLMNISFYHNISGDFALNDSVLVSGNSNSSNFNLNNINYGENFGWYCLIYDNNSNYNNSGIRNIFVDENDAPYLDTEINNISWNEDTNYSFDLDDYFGDEEDNIVGYSYSLISDISVSIDNSTGIVDLIPSLNFTGNRSVVFSAYDSEFSFDSNNISLFVNNTADCGNSIIEVGEDCEGSDLGGETCETRGYDTGDLGCNLCSFDLSGCSSDSGDSGGGESSSNSGSSDNDYEDVVEESVEVEEKKVETKTVSSSVDEEPVEEEIVEIVEPKKGLLKKILHVVVSPVRLVVWLFGLIF